MKQPLMLTQSGLPPAQAEALYETVPESASVRRLVAGDAAAWPGEDWDEDAEGTPATRIAPRCSPASFPAKPFTSSARH